MPRTRQLRDAPRVAALWLLVVSVFFGLAGIGGSTAFASANESCGVSCPCDEAAYDDRADEHDNEAMADSEDDDGDPCKGECPYDCPNCGCCLGIAMAVLPLPVTSNRAIRTSAGMLTPIDALPSGAGSGVFRPPRSLT